ncbi:MAG TPA: formylglycine-generating enzyme family protein [Chitinophagaceae bacterium]|nr:formylglycine-generating enzyme family protein [Chitinophagaceae bacterium]
MPKEKKNCCSASRPLKTGNKEDRTVKKRKRQDSSEQLIQLSGGIFLMGTDDKEGFPTDGEGPVREVELSLFSITPTTVTNKEFATFIQDTAYKTDAERYGWSFVFYALLSNEILATKPKVAVSTPWWCAIPGAVWNHPEGPHSNIADRMNHPVVHVSWNDAMAYCQWSGMHLPTEAEWEYAARGGLVQKKYPWGNELTPEGKHQCNIWQGNFPDYNSLADGYLGTAPANSFAPNGYGLYNLSGNVWEWCNDWFSPQHDATAIKNPKGPDKGQAKVMKGGSFLCHHSYCNRYRVAARTSNTADSSASNIGFRCVK